MNKEKDDQLDVMLNTLLNQYDEIMKELKNLRESKGNSFEGKSVSTSPRTSPPLFVCEKCGDKTVTQGVKDFCDTYFGGSIYCMDCQKEVKGHV